MKAKLLQYQGLILITAGIFFMGCYTQLGTVKKESRRAYSPQTEQQVYEPEYEESADTVYVEENEQQPLYQYNFYGLPPYSSGVDVYFSPFYSGISFFYGDWDPWFYDPWFYDPFWGGIYYSSFWYRPYRNFWGPYSRWGYFLGYGYYGYSSAYYGPYDPYWDYFYYNPYYVSVFEQQRRRDFEHRRELDNRVAPGTGDIYMPTVAAGGKQVSKIQRIKKKPVTARNTKLVTDTRTSKIRTRKSSEDRVRILSTKPVTQVNSSQRVIRTRKSSVLSTGRTQKPATRSKAITRTTRSVPNVIRSKPTTRRTKKSATVTTRRTKKTSKINVPSRTTRSKSSGTSYKPATTRTTRSVPIIRSTRSTTTSGAKTSSKSSSSSSRNKKK